MTRKIFPSFFLLLLMIEPALSQIIIPFRIPTEIQGKRILRSVGNIMMVYGNGATDVYQRSFDGTVKFLFRDNDPLLRGEKLARITGPSLDNYEAWALLPGTKTLYFKTLSSVIWKTGYSEFRPERILGEGDTITFKLEGTGSDQGKVGRLKMSIYPSLDGKREFVPLIIEQLPLPGSTNPSTKVFSSLFERRVYNSGVIFEQASPRVRTWTLPGTVSGQNYLTGFELGNGVWPDAHGRLIYSDYIKLGTDDYIVRYDPETKKLEILIQKGQMFFGDFVTSWRGMYPDIKTHEIYIRYQTPTQGKLIKLGADQALEVLTTQKEVGYWGKPAIIQGIEPCNTLGFISLVYNSNTSLPSPYEPRPDTLAFWDPFSNTVFPLARLGDILPDNKTVPLLDPQTGVLANADDCEGDFLTANTDGTIAGWYKVVRACIKQAPTTAAPEQEVLLEGKNFLPSGLPENPLTEVLIDGIAVRPSRLTQVLDSKIGVKMPAETGEHHLQVKVSYGGRVSHSNTVTVNVTGPPPPPLPQIVAVVNGATFRPGISPGSLATIFGTNLADKEKKADAFPLPTTLGGVTVTFDEQNKAPLWYVSSGQINFQVPLELGTPAMVRVRVIRDGVASANFLVDIEPSSPGVFQYNGFGIATHADYRLATADDPLRSGEVGILWTTGLGPTNPPAKSGEPAPHLAQTAEPIRLIIGGQEAKILFAGLTEGSVGLYQINFVVPEEISSGEGILISSSCQCPFRVPVEKQY